MIRLAGFMGEIPRPSPRLLPENAAQIAVNCKLESGSLVPVRGSHVVETLAVDSLTIFLFNGVWLSWPDFVSVARAPVATDRLYYTGSGVPKMVVGGVTYDLAVARPVTALTVAWGGTYDPAFGRTLVYAYTNVTSFGEESEPNILSDPFLWSPDPGQDVTLSGFSAPPAGRSVTLQRIYRSLTTASGTTQLFLIAERGTSTLDFIDVANATTGALLPEMEAIPSLSYNPPPAALSGLVALPNGMMAGFVGKSVYFSEPFQPHAWPEKYILLVDYDVVGLAAFGSNVAVMTTGSPYMIQGTAPENMTMERLEVNLPCLSRMGIVDMGYFVAYPSTEGLVTISSAGAELVTKQLFTRDQWMDLDPASFRATQYAGRYVATRQTPSMGVRELLFLDLTGDQPFQTRSTISVNNVYFDLPSGNLYLLYNQNSIRQWDSPLEDRATIIWRTKPFNVVANTNFGAILVEGAKGETDSLDIRVFVDGSLKVTHHEVNRALRLPSGFRGLTWEIEIIGTCRIDTISLGTSPADLATA